MTKSHVLTGSTGLNWLRSAAPLASSLLLVVLGCSLSFAAQAQLSELGATTASGGTTSAQFRGGVTADNGTSHKSTIGFAEIVDVVVEIQVEQSHVNTVGNVYVVVVTGGTFFMGLESGAFVVWDQNPANLQPIRSALTFNSSNTVPVVENIAFGPAGVSDTSLQIFVAYDTTAQAGELYYSPSPLTFAIEAEQAQVESLTIYQQSISGPIIQSLCRVCHNDNGLARASDLRYEPATETGILSNYNMLVEYIKAGNSATLLQNPTGGQGHGGGVLFTEGSVNYTNWAAFINQVISENP